jgi:Na+/melibiose symporter-like transporter
MKDMYTILVTVLAIALALMLSATYFKDNERFKDIDHQIDSLNTAIQARESAIKLLDT